MPENNPFDVLIELRTKLVEHRRNLATDMLAGKPRTGGAPPCREDFLETQQLVEAIDRALIDEQNSRR